MSVLFIVIIPPFPVVVPKYLTLNCSDTSKVKQTEPKNIPIGTPIEGHNEA
jgi:hypothetical protein